MRNLVLSCLALLATGSGAMAADRIRVLILTGESDYSHPWQPNVPFMRSMLVNSGRFDVKVEEEVRGIMTLADETAHVAKEKVEVVSRAIDTTHERVMDTTEFIQRKVIEPARELAAILAGVRRGLEVLVAPAPSPINSSYGDEEMFIG